MESGRSTGVSTAFRPSLAVAIAARPQTKRFAAVASGRGLFQVRFAGAIPVVPCRVRENLFNRWDRRLE